MKENFYGFSKSALSPFKSFAKSVGLEHEVEIGELDSPLEVNGEIYLYRLSIDVKLSEIGLKKAASVYDGLEKVRNRTTFRYIPGRELTSYFQHPRIKEERKDVVNTRFANKEMFACNS